MTVRQLLRCRVSEHCYIPKDNGICAAEETPGHKPGQSVKENLLLPMQQAHPFHDTGGMKQMVCVRRLMSQLADIRQQLVQYQVGTVELQKNTDTGIAVLTLHNPGRKNGLSGSMMVELADHVTELSQWQEGKGLILRGADDTFCSGGDLKTMSAIMNGQDGARMSQFMHDTLTRLHSLPLVSLALIQGVALGGGAELATACDIRAMTEAAKLGFVQIKMGVTTGWGGATRLLRHLGRPKALQLLGSGKVLTAQEAVNLGFVEHVLPEQPSPLQLAETLLLDTYCRGSTDVARAVKRIVVDVENSGNITEALASERKVFASVWAGEAHKAALEKNIKHS